MSPEAIELTWRTTPEAARDALTWRRYRPRPLRQRLLVGALGLAAGVALAVVYSLLTGQALDLASFALGLLTAVLMLGLFRRMALRRQLQEHLERAPAEVTARFDSDGVTLSAEGNRTFARWAAVRDIIAGRGGTILRIGTSVVVVPHAALGDLSPEAFARAVRTLWKAAG